MNKPIFQKIKQSHLSSITQSPSSHQNIQHMSVQDMQKTLLTHINASKDHNQNNIAISLNSDSSKNRHQNLSHSATSFSKNSIVESRRIPEIVMENDQLRYEIERLKNEKNMILSQYQNLSTFTKSYAELHADNNKRQYEREFSFRKSVQNANKLISSSNGQQQKPTRQPGIRQQRHLGSINQRNIPSSDGNRNSHQQQTERRSGASLQSSKAMLGNMRKSLNKQTFSTLQQRFYQYCKTQMVRMNTQNTKLTLKISELESRIAAMGRECEMLEKENQQLKSVNESLEERLKAENQRIQKINQAMSITLAKKEQIVDNELKHLQTQLKQLRTQQQSLRKILNQKDSQIAILKSQLTNKTSQTKNYTQLVSKNASLQNQLNQVMVRNKKLGDKFRRMPIIDHLWEIKQVEYQNLVNFIQKGKGELNSLQQSRGYENNKKSFSAMHDMTFSKDRNAF